MIWLRVEHYPSVLLSKGSNFDCLLLLVVCMFCHYRLFVTRTVYFIQLVSFCLYFKFQSSNYCAHKWLRKYTLYWVPNSTTTPPWHRQTPVFVHCCLSSIPVSLVNLEITRSLTTRWMCMIEWQAPPPQHTDHGMFIFHPASARFRERRHRIHGGTSEFFLLGVNINNSTLLNAEVPALYLTQI